MKYKVGDKVRIKSLEWYNKNKDELGNIDYSSVVFFESDMSKFCDSILTIKNIDTDINAYDVEENEYYWTDDMIEGLVEEKEIYKSAPNKICRIFISDEDYQDKVELCLGDDYEIVVEDGKTFVQRKKSKYPKTFIEVLNFWHPDRQIEDDYQIYYKKDLIEKFQNLLYARDAYWKIAGEEMGLGKSWEFENPSRRYVFTIEYSGGKIILNAATSSMLNRILVFPTKEMRDAFYQNFKNLIEQCKNLI